MALRHQVIWLGGAFPALASAWWGRLREGSGVRPALAGGTEGLPPRPPGFGAIALLVLAIGLLLLPGSRDGLRAVAHAWEVSQQHEEKLTSRLQELGREAETSGDAPALAFVALQIPPSAEAIRMMDRAVALEPQLTWIYAALVDSRCAQLPVGDRLERLRRWDSGNGSPYLLQAAWRKEHLDREFRRTHPDPWFRPHPAETQVLAGDAAWQAAMKEAFEAARYDSYAERRRALDRAVMLAHGMSQPDFVFESLIWYPHLDLAGINIYADQLLAEGDSTLRTGAVAAAESRYGSVAGFSRKLRVSNSADLGHAIGAALLHRADARLEPILAREGHSDEALRIAEEQRELQQEKENGIERTRAWLTLRRTGFHGWSTLPIHLGAGFIIVFGMLSTISLLWLGLRYITDWSARTRLHRWACFTARYASAGLLAGAVAVYLAYRSCAGAIDRYLTGSTGPADVYRLQETIGALYQLPSAVSASISYLRLIFWSTAAAAGALCVLYLLLRLMRRSARAAA